MTPANFKRMCADIRRMWTRKDGLVAKLGTGGLKRVLRICVSSTDNTGLIAENCKVWDDDALVYEGKIEDDGLKELLTSACVCRGELLTGLDMAAGRQGKRICYGTRNGCPKACPLAGRKQRLVGEEAQKALVKALQEGKPVVMHEKIGMSIVNATGVERTCMAVPKPGADNAEQ